MHKYAGCAEILYRLRNFGAKEQSAVKERTKAVMDAASKLLPVASHV